MERTPRSFSEDEISGPDTIILIPAEDAAIRAAEEQADREAEEVRVTMRWKKGQLDLVQRAVARYGMPYQTYVKHAAVRQAIADLQELARLPPSRERPSAR